MIDRKLMLSFAQINNYLVATGRPPIPSRLPPPPAIPDPPAVPTVRVQHAATRI
jgi:hypothetical protein